MSKETPEQYRARRRRIKNEKEERHQAFLIREEKRQKYQREKAERHQSFLIREAKRQKYQKRMNENLKKFEFDNTLLNWTILYNFNIHQYQLNDHNYTATPIRSLLHLQRNYRYPENRNDYYENFKPLILEEVKSAMKIQLKKINYHDEGDELCIIKNVDDNDKNNKNSQIPSNFLMTGGKSFHDSVMNKGIGTSEIILFEKSTGVVMLGNISRKNENNIYVKCFVNINNNNNNNWDQKLTFKKGNCIEVYVLTSVITQKRMYKVCNEMKPFEFEKEIITSVCNNHKFKNEYYYEMSFNDECTERLNEIQYSIVEEFLYLDRGIYLVQGPPGTGKSFTLGTLIKCLVEKNVSKKIIVTAPSNKAVQVIMKMFLKLCPIGTYPVILIGVENKLDDDLKDVFIHTWKDKVESITTYLIEHFQSDEEEQEQGFMEEYNRLKKIVQPFFGFNYLNNTGSLNQLLSKIRSYSSDDIENILLKVSKVIFATQSVCGRKSFQDIKPDVLIVDEAAQSVESETLIPLSLSPRKCILVGDTKQLPATVISDTAGKYNYCWSLMWRLIEECDVKCRLLEVQYRMEKKIRQFPSVQYYDGRLKDGENISSRHNNNDNPFLIENNSIFGDPRIFINVSERFEKRVNDSYTNESEAWLIVKTIQFFKRKNINISRIGVICFYSSQVELIKKKLRSNGIKEVKVHTVDFFQGDEMDLIIISFVRSNKKGVIGFLRDFRRLNVALTRAKFMLLMLGDVNTLIKNEKHIHSLISYYKKEGRIFNSSDFKKIIEVKRKSKNHYKRRSLNAWSQNSKRYNHDNEEIFYNNEKIESGRSEKASVQRDNKFERSKYINVRGGNINRGNIQKRKSFENSRMIQDNPNNSRRTISNRKQMKEFRGNKLPINRNAVTVTNNCRVCGKECNVNLHIKLCKGCYRDRYFY